jgi:hypothetical protein
MSDADTCRVAKSLAAQATSTWSGARAAPRTVAKQRIMPLAYRRVLGGGTER